LASDEEDKDQRTEQASSKRLQKAREQGDVAVSRDVAMFAGLAVGAVLLTWAGSGLRDRLVKLVQAAALAIATGQTRDILPLVTSPTLLVLGVCAGACASAVVAQIAQTGGGFWLDKVMPDLTKVVNPGRITKLFKKEGLADLGMSLVKVLTLGWVLWSTIRDDFMTLPNLLQADTAMQLAGLFRPLTGGLAKILTGLGLIAGLDFALTRYRYTSA
jgi:flagellar biosynthetic protein FlhB